MRNRISPPDLARRAVLAASLFPFLTLIGCAAPASVTPPDRRARQQAALRALGFVSTDDGWELNLAANMTFSVDGSELAASDTANLVHLARELLVIGIDRIVVEGHADSQGSVEHNRGLSERRAGSVAEVLVASGFAPDKVIRRALGATRPIGDNDTEAGRLKNRRAVLMVQSL